MSILKRQTAASVDIITAAQVLSYLNPATTSDRVMMVHVVLGETSPIAGDGTYQLIVKIDGQTVSPVSNVAVAAGNTETRMQS